MKGLWLQSGVDPRKVHQHGGEICPCCDIHFEDRVDDSNPKKKGFIKSEEIYNQLKAGKSMEEIMAGAGLHVRKDSMFFKGFYNYSFFQHLFYHLLLFL